MGLEKRLNEISNELKELISFERMTVWILEEVKGQYLVSPIYMEQIDPKRRRDFSYPAIKHNSETKESFACLLKKQYFLINEIKNDNEYITPLHKKIQYGLKNKITMSLCYLDAPVASIQLLSSNPNDIFLYEHKEILENYTKRILDILINNNVVHIESEFDLNVLDFLDYTKRKLGYIWNNLKTIETIKYVDNTLDKKVFFYNKVFTSAFESIYSSISKIDARLQLMKQHSENRSASLDECIKDMTGLKSIETRDYKQVEKYLSETSISKQEQDFILSMIAHNENIRSFNHQIAGDISGIFYIEELKELVDEEKELFEINPSSEILYESEQMARLIEGVIGSTSKFLNTASRKLNRHKKYIPEIKQIKVQEIVMSLESLIAEAKHFTFNKKTSQIDLKVLTSGDVDKDIFVDQAIITDVIVTLVKNALEELATASSKTVEYFNKEVVVDIRVIDAFMKISVKDNGRGIPQANRNKIFKKYFSYGKIGGTGYGLDEVNCNVTLLNGTIEIESKYNKDRIDSYTEFLITIPIIKG